MLLITGTYICRVEKIKNTAVYSSVKGVFVRIYKVERKTSVSVICVYVCMYIFTLALIYVVYTYACTYVGVHGTVCLCMYTSVKYCMLFLYTVVLE